MSRHASAVPWITASASAQALGIYGGFRLYTLRRAQPLSMCRHTGAGHSCHRFRLHDRRVPFPSPDPLGTLGLPGIVSFHSHSPHGGCDPPALISGLVRPCGVCAQPNFTGPPERSRFYGLRLMVNEVRNERKGVEVHPSLYTLYFRMAHLFRPPKRVKSICFGRIRLRFILSFSVVPAEIVQADVIVVCDLLQLS